MDARLRALWGERVYSRLPLIGRWLRRVAVRKLAADDSPESVGLLALAVARTDDPDVRLLALEALEGIDGKERPRCAEAVCVAWAAARHPLLEALLTVHGWGEKAPLAVRVLYYLATGREETLAGEGTDVVGPLLEGCRDPDPVIAARARAVLGRLRDVGAREALCQAALDDAIALELATTAGYAPRDPERRALFYFLTEQWDAYDALDFDRRLLRAAYMAAPDTLRRRIAARARQAGRVDWVEVVTGQRLVRLGEMNDAEWQAAADVLVSQARWQEVWRLAQEAPASWSAWLLRLLPTGYVPEADRDAVELVRLAAAWVEPHLASMLRLTAEHDEPSPPAALAVSPDGALFVTRQGGIGQPQLFRLPDGTRLPSVREEPPGDVPLKSPQPGLDDIFGAITITPRGRWLLAGDGRGRLWRWALPGGECLDVALVSGEPVTCLAVSSRGLLLALGGEDGRVRLWDLHEGRPLRTLRRHGQGVTCLAWSPDGRLLASGGADGCLCLWSIPEGDLLQVWRDAGPVRAAAFCAGGDVALGLWQGAGVRPWAVSSGAALPPPRGHANTVECMAVAPDGSLLATGGRDHTVRLWSLPDCRPVGLLAGHTAAVTCLAVNPDGRVLASGSADSTVELWDLPDGQPLRTLLGLPGPVHQLAVSPDGRAMIALAANRVAVWATELVHLAMVPPAQLTPAEVAWLSETLGGDQVSVEERAALAFIAALTRRRKRFDIQLAEVAPRITVGEFDIEIAG